MDDRPPEGLFVILVVSETVWLKWLWVMLQCSVGALMRESYVKALSLSQVVLANGKKGCVLRSARC